MATCLKNMSEDKGKNIIGIFDSGLGGLTIFKDLKQKLPGYNYIYLGDNARLPYGGKSQETIYNYTKEAVQFLFKQGCNLIIIACNTASAQALRRLQNEYLPTNYPSRRLLGVIRPLVEAASQEKKYRRIGVIGTKATINSNAYRLELAKLAPQLIVEQQSAPLIVPLIEENWQRKPETKMILKKYLRPLKIKKIEALILACTHYPFLYHEIKQIMGRRVKVFHPGEIIASSLKDYLNRHEELGLELVKNPETKYYTTDDPQAFKALAERFLEEKINTLNQVDITSN